MGPLWGPIVNSTVIIIVGDDYQNIFAELASKSQRSCVRVYYGINAIHYPLFYIFIHQICSSFMVCRMKVGTKGGRNDGEAQHMGSRIPVTRRAGGLKTALCSHPRHISQISPRNRFAPTVLCHGSENRLVVRRPPSRLRQAGVIIEHTWCGWRSVEFC